MQSPTDDVETGYGVLRTVEWDVLGREMAVRGDLRRVAQTTRGTSFLAALDYPHPNIKNHSGYKGRLTNDKQTS